MDRAGTQVLAGAGSRAEHRQVVHGHARADEGVRAVPDVAAHGDRRSDQDQTNPLENTLRFSLIFDFEGLKSQQAETTPKPE